MSRIVLFNKPFQVLSQFTDAESRSTLADYIAEKAIYPAGRLDYDSEGLLILTGDGNLQARISSPKFKLQKTYWVQVEGKVSDEALGELSGGVELKDGMTLPAIVKEIPEPEIWNREPPVRERVNVPTSWIELSIREGRNRQVRRMTAACGLPTLRLIRTQIGPWVLGDLLPGQYRTESVNLPKAHCSKKSPLPNRGRGKNTRKKVPRKRT